MTATYPGHWLQRALSMRAEHNGPVARLHAPEFNLTTSAKKGSTIYGTMIPMFRGFLRLRFIANMLGR